MTKVKRIKPTIINKLKFLIVCFMLIILVSLMSNTFSKYVSSADGDLNVSFAKWQILVNNLDISDAANSEILFVPVIDSNNEVEENSVAPSSSGYFDIAIDPSNVALSFNYNITFSIENDDIPDLMISEYAILPVDDSPIEKISLDNNIIEKDMIYDPENPFKPFTIRLFFKWYEGENELMDDLADTEIGTVAAINDTKLKMKANISFKQIKEGTN
ncbi:MAG: hypothetical protein MR411_05105 [Tenericutes bacterium]|nr:hypothetical protein [Mycoplasmatota bacterium]